jgi:hypothetical protein
MLALKLSRKGPPSHKFELPKPTQPAATTQIAAPQPFKEDKSPGSFSDTGILEVIAVALTVVMMLGVRFRHLHPLAAHTWAEKDH